MKVSTKWGVFTFNLTRGRLTPSVTPQITAVNTTGHG